MWPLSDLPLLVGHGAFMLLVGVQEGCRTGRLSGSVKNLCYLSQKVFFVRTTVERQSRGNELTKVHVEHGCLLVFFCWCCCISKLLLCLQLNRQKSR